MQDKNQDKKDQKKPIEENKHHKPIQDYPENQNTG